MSRTWREIPDNGFRDRTNPGTIALEEKKGRVHHTERVRDKDNHHCLYSKPKDHKQRHKRRYRSRVNDQLRKIEQHLWNAPTDRIGLSAIYISVDDLNIILPKPKEYQPYYW